MTEPQPRSAWILTDGKAGDLVQCQGVARALGVLSDERTVRPRSFYDWPVPGLPVDPREREDRPDSPIAPPYPDLVIASGRRAVPYLLRIKALSPATFTVFLKDPRTGPEMADFIWVPQHDRLRGDNVLVTLTSPHTLSAERLAAARASPWPEIERLSMPRVAVLVGGDSARTHFTAGDIRTFSDRLEKLAQSPTSLMGTFSRRTDASDPRLKDDVAAIFARHDGYLWDGTGQNPYVQLLANADGIVVTTDSVNMVGEAVATGAPVMVFRSSDRRLRTNRKAHAFLHALAERGAIHSFTGDLETGTYEPLNSTPEIAREIVARFQAFRTTAPAP